MFNYGHDMEIIDGIQSKLYFVRFRSLMFGTYQASLTVSKYAAFEPSFPYIYFPSDDFDSLIT